MSATIEPVIAGSRGFALALLAPLTERIGTRPRIAAGAAQARPFCTGPGGLVVVEFVGAETLHEIEALVREAKGIRVVAAVPEKLAAAGAPLRALGVEVARWDGTATDIVGAVGRQLALASAPAAPAASRGPVKTPAPASAPQRPSSAARPAAMTPAPPTASRPAAATRAPSQPGVASRPPPAASAAQPSGQPRPSSRPTPTPPRPIAAPPAAAAPAAAPAAFTPSPVPGFALAPVKQSAPAPVWPATVLDPVKAAEALCDALAAGDVPEGSPLAPVAEVLATLSDLERAVLAGEPQPIDPEPIRRAAVMRVRVASALATAPRGGAAVDAAAVSALIAEIDGLLSKVNDVGQSAPEELQASLEAVRNGLVREAIDFSEAAQRASPAEPRADATAPRPRSTSKASKTRLLAVDEAEARASRLGLVAWIALGAVAALAAGYHGWQWHTRGQARSALSAGLPAGLTQIPGPPGGPRVLVRSSTKDAPDPAELARLKAVEEANGNKVREVDGMIFIEPANRDAAPPPEPAKP